MFGLGLGIARAWGSGGPPMLLDANFRTATPGALSSATLTGLALAFSRASGARPQTGPTSVSPTALAVDEAGIEDDGTAHGLLLEEASTNENVRSQAFVTSWVLIGGATATASYANGPDGVALSGTRIQAPGGAGVLGENGASANATQATVSLWSNPTFGALSSCGINLYRNSTTLRHFDTALHTTWRRMAATFLNGPTELSASSLVDGRDWSGSGGLTAGARDFVIWGAQREVLAYPTSYILTTGATATRAATRLRHTSPAALLDGGRLNILIDLAPLAARGEYKSTRRIWSLNATHYATITDAGVVAVTINGATFTCGTAVPAWARRARARLHIAAGGGALNTVCRWRSAGTTVDLGTSGAAQAAIVPVGGDVLDILSDGTSSVFSAVLERARAFPASYVPDMAA